MKIFQKKLLIAGIPILVLLWFLWSNLSVSGYDENTIVDFYTIKYPSEHNYKQVSTQCGPFNTAAVVRAMTSEEVNSILFAEDIGWQLFDLGTLPLGLKHQLEQYNLEVEVARLKSYSNEERLLFLQERLSNGKPIIILGEKDDYQHYVTLFGFNNLEDEYYIYDSWYPEGLEGLVIDDNASLPGNRTLSSKELLDFWQKGGMFGFYSWYALVAG